MSAKDPFWDDAFGYFLALPTAEAREEELMSYGPPAEKSLRIIFQIHMKQALTEIENELRRE